MMRKNIPEIDQIPEIDLRLAYLMGNPFIPIKRKSYASPKKPRREVDIEKAVSITVYATAAIIALVFASVTIALFGPIFGLLILFGFLAKLKI